MSDDGLLPVPDDLELGPTIRGLVPGQIVIERYTLRRVVGRGGMGVVWLARDEKLEEDVALKFLPEMVRLDAPSLDELKRETRRSRSLTHPHIVRIHDFLEDHSCAAISMEYVDGPSLSALRMDRSSRVFNPSELVPWLRQLCEALTYAHEKVKIAHRDLKPANLMVNSQGDLKIADFGIASSLSDSVSRVTMNRGSSGTLAYMSPQQALGKKPTPTDDIYSLGATLYELLTSKPPFYSGNIQHQLETIVPPTMAERRADLEIVGEPIPPEWEETIADCLAKEPSQRPQSMTEVAQLLGLNGAGMGRARVAVVPTTARIEPPAPVLPPVPATPSAMPPPAPKPPRKSGGSLVSIILLLLVGGGALGWYFGIEKPSEEEQIRQAQIAQQEAIEKEKDLEAQQAADAQQKAQLEAQAQAAADEAAKLKAQADQQAADEAAAKAKADAEAAQAAQEKAQAEAAAQAAYPKAGQEWYNSLGMKFVPAGTDGVLFGTWDVRVQDYQAFIQATGYQMPGGINVIKVITNNNGSSSLQWQIDPTASWQNPGFAQGPTNPVVGVSWNDAIAFCNWLTKKEQAEGKIGSNQSYRLPTDAEWTTAAGDGKYPWGDVWPPPSDAGNYGDQTFAASLTGSGWPQACLQDSDGYARTSPVGSFRPNAYGLYDMGGNVFQWCMDWFQASMNNADARQKWPTLNNDGGGSVSKVLRGGCWSVNDPLCLATAYYNNGDPNYRGDDFGFRVVLVVSGQ